MNIITRVLNIKDYIAISLIAGCYILAYSLQLSHLSYVIIAGIYLIILFSNLEYAILYTFTTIPCMGLFDSIGFKYFYNIAFILLLFKIIISRPKSLSTINKTLIVLFFIFSFYNLVIGFVNKLNYKDLLINTSGFFTSTMIFALLLGNKILNLKKAYYYLGIFILVSFLLGYIYDLIRFDFVIPDMHRLVGLMRDPNYFSAYAAIVTFMAYPIFKKIKVLSILIFAVALWSVSKMFLLISIVTIILLLIMNYKYFINLFKVFKNLVLWKKIIIICVSLVVLAIAIIFIQKVGYKYLIRLKEFSLLTGRGYIWSEYFKYLGNDQLGLIFGKSMSYNQFYNVVYSDSHMVAHNTFLDILLSFGIFGYIIIALAVIYILKKEKLQFNINAISLVVIIFILMMSLSYLMTDNFYILLLVVFELAIKRKEPAINKSS